METIGLLPEQKLKYGKFAYNEQTNPIISYNDFYLDADGRNLVLYKDNQAIEYVARNVVLTLRGELQYDIYKGIPYIGTIFSDSNLVPIWQSYMEEAIKNVNGVRDISYFETDYNPQTQVLSYRCGLITEYGEIEINEQYLQST